MGFADRWAPRTAALAAALVVTSAGGASAQNQLADGCAERAANADTQAYCALVVQAADILPARVGMVTAGGNPVPGTASTLGIRLGTFPRFSVAGRGSIIWVGLPRITRPGAGEDVDFIAHSLNADVSVGLYSGLSPFATVGGVGSIDLLGSLGIARLPGDDGSNEDAPITWAVGARLGITRESFTAPGMSISALYRRLGEVTYGDTRLEQQDAFVHVDELSLWSVRGTIGKRITLFGLTGGIGWDRYSGRALVRIRDGAAGTIEIRDADHTGDRWNVFANGAWTLLILSATAEVGWQFGGDTPAGATSDAIASGALFGSFAIRLAL
ncbi:MAG: hypothetical protein ACRELX_11070 [Longimicrobiales bacterium]